MGDWDGGIILGIRNGNGGLGFWIGIVINIRDWGVELGIWIGDLRLGLGIGD